jgi:hypothetical protein
VTYKDPANRGTNKQCNYYIGLFGTILYVECKKLTLICLRILLALFLVVGMNTGTGIGTGIGIRIGVGNEYMASGVGQYSGTGTGIRYLSGVDLPSRK